MIDRIFSPMKEHAQMQTALGLLCIPFALHIMFLRRPSKTDFAKRFGTRRTDLQP